MFDAVLARLDAAFESAIAASLGEARACSVLFSGGVDSTIVAAAIPAEIDVELLTIGAPGRRDPPAAERAATWLGRTVRWVRLAPTDVQDAARDLADREGRSPDRTDAVQVALAIATAHARDPLVLTGQGADELFGGYAHFRGLPEHDRARRRAEDLDRLLRVDWPRSLRIAAQHAVRLRAPFLAPEFVAVAGSLPIGPEGPGGLTKIVARRWASHRGLPTWIAERPKVALQYGSGVARWLPSPPRPLGGVRRAGASEIPRAGSRGSDPRARPTPDRRAQ